MFGLNQESLRLCGINVAGGVVFGLRNGSNQAEGQTPTNLSFTRHLTWYSDADSDPRKRYERPALTGADHAPQRTGRSGCSTGVLAGRSSAISAERAIRFGWPAFGRAHARRDWRHVRSLAPTIPGKRLSDISRIPGRATTATTLRTGPCTKRTLRVQRPAAMLPAVGMPGNAMRGQ